MYARVLVLHSKICWSFEIYRLPGSHGVYFCHFSGHSQYPAGKIAGNIKGNVKDVVDEYVGYSSTAEKDSSLVPFPRTPKDEF